MAKKVIKEIIIILLLCLAIILVLGVLLYEYVPINKIIPEAVSYTTPEDISEEINKEVDPIPIMTYSTNSTDLNNYERINTYVPGKPNPFSDYSSTSGQNTTNSSSGSSSTGSSSNGNTTSGNGTASNTTTSGGSYIPDKGTK